MAAGYVDRDGNPWEHVFRWVGLRTPRWYDVRVGLCGTDHEKWSLRWMRFDQRGFTALRPLRRLTQGA